MGILISIVITALFGLGVVVCDAMFPNSLDIYAFFCLNLTTMLVNMVVLMISFFFSCLCIGTAIGDVLHIKRFRLKANKDACINCHLCDKICPMSLKVSEKVQIGKMDDSECILCGSCIDKCPKKAIGYKFK